MLKQKKKRRKKILWKYLMISTIIGNRLLCNTVIYFQFKWLLIYYLWTDKKAYFLSLFPSDRSLKWWRMNGQDVGVFCIRFHFDFLKFWRKRREKKQHKFNSSFFNEWNIQITQRYHFISFHLNHIFFSCDFPLVTLLLLYLEPTFFPNTLLNQPKLKSTRDRQIPNPLVHQ